MTQIYQLYNDIGLFFIIFLFLCSKLLVQKQLLIFTWLFITKKNFFKLRYWNALWPFFSICSLETMVWCRRHSKFADFWLSTQVCTHVQHAVASENQRNTCPTEHRRAACVFVLDVNTWRWSLWVNVDEGVRGMTGGAKRAQSLFRRINPSINRVAQH